MYLNRAKKLLPRFIQLMQEKGKVHQYEPCTEQDIHQIERFLNLPIPVAYREFLLWSRKQCYFMDEIGLPFYSSEKVDLRRIALNILEMNEATESLPDDAIVTFIFDETAAFAFIRVSEGDNPPVHYFGGRRANGESAIKWNWAATIEELCIDCMHDRVEQVYFTEMPEHLLKENS